MELDKRIKDINDIQSVLNSSKDIIGKKGYLAKSIRDFKNLNKCEYNIIDDYREDDECFCHTVKFTTGIIDTTWYSYFIPEDVLKPEELKKKYRPYSLNEFLDEHEIGDKITYRLKLEEQDEKYIRNKKMFCGYQILTGEANTPGKGFIDLGGALVSLQTLFEDYETPNSYLYPEVWEPFGVLDE